MFAFTIQKVHSQEKKIKKNPKKAAVMSAIIPGMGQIYNKKYWKLPIIYGSLITSAYFIKESNNNYLIYKEAYLGRIDNDTETKDEFKYGNDQLLILKDHYKRNREISSLFFVLSYILNIIDASVDAHLFNYEINDNLSLHLETQRLTNSGDHTICISLKL